MAVTKEKRRQYRSGSVSQRKSDGRWVGAIMDGWNANGTRRRITVTAKTEAECKRKLELKKGEVARKETATTGRARATVKSWSVQWLEHIKATVRPKTWSGYQSAVKVSINPAIGHRRLDSLTPADLRAVAVLVEKNGNTSTTARHAVIALKKMLKDAVIEGHTVPQRVLLISPPGKSPHDRGAIPTVDTRDILTQAVQRSDGSRWIAAFLQGMRQGECLGLTWPCVDLDNRVVDVSWQLQAIPYEHDCGPVVNRRRPCGHRFGGDCPDRIRRVPPNYECRPLDGALCLVRPKTERGQRIIPLVPWLHAALTEWNRIAPASPHGLVWPRPNGRPALADEDTATFRDLQDAAQVACVDGALGRHYHIHECRNTTATLLLEARIDPETVKTILGHSSIVTSRGYQTVSQQLARQALDAVASQLQLG